MVAPPIAASILVFFPLCLLYLSLALTFILLLFETKSFPSRLPNNVFHLLITSLTALYALLVHIRAHIHTPHCVYVCDRVGSCVCMHVRARHDVMLSFREKKKKKKNNAHFTLLFVALMPTTPSSSSFTTKESFSLPLSFFGINVFKCVE